MAGRRSHPTVEIPGIGPVDHAWDALGDWQVAVEFPDSRRRVRGLLTLEDWSGGALQLDEPGAGAAGLPAEVALSRTTDVARAEVGGGALTWEMEAAAADWALRAVLWPGEMHLIVTSGREETELFRLRARRSGEYYAAKYP